MPGGDGTGPMGYGPGTGWGLGPCGRGLALRKRYGRGRGFSIGFRRGVISEDEEKEVLEDELKYVQQEKEGIEKRLKELKSK